MVERLFLAVPGGCLQFVIVVFPDHTHLLISHIEDVHLLSCAHFMNIFSILGVLNLDIFRPKCLDSVWFVLYVTPTVFISVGQASDSMTALT